MISESVDPSQVLSPPSSHSTIYLFWRSHAVFPAGISNLVESSPFFQDHLSSTFRGSGLPASIESRSETVIFFNRGWKAAPTEITPGLLNRWYLLAVAQHYGILIQKSGMPMKIIDNFDKERYAPEMFEFRHEKSRDIAGIRKVHESAFERRYNHSIPVPHLPAHLP